MDCYHGGDYDQYALEITEFFRLLHFCNIELYVVFDGGNDPNDLKFQTLQERMKQKLENAKRIANGLRGQKRVMPILAFNTFKAVLKKLRIPFAVCDFEADKEIAMLANALNCPVLSNDSDFFIFPLTGGFISFDQVIFNLQEIKGENNSVEHFLPTRRYHFDYMLQIFPSLGKEVLPLLAALLGNDYIDKDVFKSFYDSIQSNECETQDWNSPDDKRTLKVVLWLQGLKSYSEGIKEIMSKAESQNEKTISSALKTIIETFQTNAPETESSLYSYFMGKRHISENQIRGVNGFVIPMWYLYHHRKGLISPNCLDIITLHRKFLSPQVEDPNSLASSYQSSVNLRKNMYGILLSEDSADFETNEARELAANMKSVVEEFDRRGDIIISQVISPVKLETYSGKSIKLSDIPDLSRNEKKNLLRRILNIPCFNIDHMTTDLELILGIVIFWIKNSKRKVTISHLQSVLVCLIMLKVKWALIYPASIGCDKNFIEAAVFDIKTKTLKSINAKLSKYTKSRTSRVDCGLIHGFAQFQTCIMATMHLNSLLLEPFPGPYIPHIFSGTFLYNFCKELHKRRNPDQFIYEMLSRNSNLRQIYQWLFDAVDNAVGPTAFTYTENRYHYSEYTQYGGKLHDEKCLPHINASVESCSIPLFLRKTRIRLKRKDQVQQMLLCTDLEL